MAFNSVFYQIKSSYNIGNIIRSHVAFGGKKLIFVGYKDPFEVKRGTLKFSKRLEQRCDILNFSDDESFLKWSKENQYKNLAVEISANAKSIVSKKFPENFNLILGNEVRGLPHHFLDKVDEVITIPHHGQVGSLNVAVAASLCFYEITRLQKSELVIKGGIYNVE